MSRDASFASLNIPYTWYKSDIRGKDTVMFVVPEPHPLFGASRAGSCIRIAGMDYASMEEAVGGADPEPLERRYYDVVMVVETRLRDLGRRFWENRSLIGPKSHKEFVEFWGDPEHRITPDTLVRHLTMRGVEPNLKLLKIQLDLDRY